MSEITNNFLYELIDGDIENEKEKLIPGSCAVERDIIKKLSALTYKAYNALEELIKIEKITASGGISDIETVKAKYNPDPEQFSINVLGKVYTDKVEGGRALMEALNAHRPETVVAEYAGLKISLNPLSLLNEERNVSLTGAGQYRMEIGDSEIGLLRRLDNFMKDFPEREPRAKNKLNELENNLKVAQGQLDVPFEHADELESLLKEQAELNAELVEIKKQIKEIYKFTKEGGKNG